MKRLITFTVVFTAVFCTSCKEKPKPDPPQEIPQEVVVPPKKYVVGSYYDEKGVQGIVYQVSADSTKGMIISLDETTCAWAKNSTVAAVETTAIDGEDGTKNMAKIKEKGIDDYPAFKWCDEKNTGTVSGWYLPAQNELWDLAELHEVLQDSLDAYKGTKLTTAGDYWSSTEHLVIGNPEPYMFAMYVKLTVNPPSTQSLSKYQVCKVRAIKAF